MSKTENYSSQKKYLSEKKKSMKVWVDPEAYEKFKECVKKNNTSVYALINQYIKDYVEENS